MSITDRIGWRRTRVNHQHALTVSRALTTSRALIAQARQETQALAADLAALQDEAEPGAIQCEDAQSSARSLSQTLAALEAIGWPHEHGPDA